MHKMFRNVQFEPYFSLFHTNFFRHCHLQKIKGGGRKDLRENGKIRKFPKSKSSRTDFNSNKNLH